MQQVTLPMKGWMGKGLGKLWGALRVNTGMQMMVLNVANTMQQLTGVSIAAVQVKPKYLRNAAWEYVHGPNVMAEIVNAKSDYMKHRMTSQEFEMQSRIERLLTDAKGLDRLRDFAQEHGYFLQAGTQNVVDIITWTGAYNQAVEQGANEKDAVRRADSVVRETQGSFAPEDISRAETGTAFVRLFTQFYSYFNMQANLLGTEFTKTVRNLGVKKGAGRLLYIYAMGAMIPMVLSEAIVQAVGGFDDGDDDDYDLWDAMRLFFNAQWRPLLGMVPGAGSAITAGINAWNDKPYDDRMSTSPAVSMIESAVRAPKSVYQAIAGEGSWKRGAKDMLTLLGMITRLPLGQLGKPIGYALDVAQGKVEPKGASDVVRGVLSGKDVERKQ